MKLPTVVIVGRMNVGKSTLFNRLSTSVKSMTRDHAGITRDFIRDAVSWNKRTFELIDTGGLSFRRKNADTLQEKIHEKAYEALKNADLVLLLVDGAIGLVTEDREVVRQLYALQKTFIVVINKVDSQAVPAHIHEFSACGGKETIAISAEHGTNIGDLLDTIIKYLPTPFSPLDTEERAFNVTLLGRPNVGKSSLMNALVRYERAIVFDEPGTTREAVSERITFDKEHLILTDTPGLRRKSAISEELEEDMAYSSLQALAATDVVLLVIDGSTGALVDQELKLGFYAFTERHKALIIIVNKADIMHDAERDALATAAGPYHHLLGKVPVLTISCVSEKNVGKVLPTIQQVWKRHSQQLPTAEIYHLFMQALEKSPLMHKKLRLIVKEVRQLATAPITLGMSVNEPAWFGASQRAFFENILRKHYDLFGAPIKFIIRKKLSRGA